jgi:hypothetical protein
VVNFAKREVEIPQEAAARATVSAELYSAEALSDFFWVGEHVEAGSAARRVAGSRSLRCGYGHVPDRANLRDRKDERADDLVVAEVYRGDAAQRPAKLAGIVYKLSCPAEERLSPRPLRVNVYGLIEQLQLEPGQRQL